MRLYSRAHVNNNISHAIHIDRFPEWIRLPLRQLLVLQYGSEYDPGVRGIIDCCIYSHDHLHCIRRINSVSSKCRFSILGLFSVGRLFRIRGISFRCSSCIFFCCGSEARGEMSDLGLYLTLHTPGLRYQGLGWRRELTSPRREGLRRSHRLDLGNGL